MTEIITSIKKSRKVIMAVACPRSKTKDYSCGLCWHCVTIFDEFEKIIDVVGEKF